MVTDGVIITDDRLLTHINKNYPKLKTKDSILKMSKVVAKDRTANYYNELLERYDFVVLHPDDNLKFDLIKQIHHIDHVEVLVDERCTQNCPIRDWHYSLTAQLNEEDHKIKEGVINQKSMDLMMEWNQMWSQCPREHSVELKNDKKINLNIIPNSVNEVEELYGLGIRIFKTSGRGEYAKELFALNRFLELAVDEEKILLGLKYFL